MGEFVIEVESFSKRFADVLAVDSVDLRVRRGELYAFLGLNGAGKTTTIRALLGMIHPSEGKIRILGQELGRDGRGPWHQVGHLVENPSAYPDLTVRENLEVARRLQGVPDDGPTLKMIDQLNLASYADRKAGTLSSGNFQRLSLARALLHEPELLILDEPANGLDPAGVVEIRELLKLLVKEQGVTVFMSSHILSEVDRLASRIGIIHKGRLIEELDSTQVDSIRAKRLEIKARNLEGAKISLQSAGLKPTLQGETIVIVNPYAIEHPDEIARLLVNAGSPPTHLAVEQQDLEEHFMQTTGSAT